MTNEINIIANGFAPKESASVNRSDTSFQVAKVSGQENTNAVQETNPENIEEIVSEMNEFVQNVNRELLFSVDEDLGDTVITVVDKTNDEVIRKIPSDEIMQLRKNMEEMRGVLFSESS